jgi:acyl-coenzyme A synthetase/AMP-(fatty) acid ligase
MLLETYSDGFISDGEASVSYGELPRRFEELDRVFHRESEIGDWFVFPCGNTLNEAVLLLWLLKRQRSFLLVPPTAMALLPVPSFCRLLVRVEKGTGTLSFEENGDYSPPPQWLAAAPALLLRTSGSTAAPKLALHRHDSLLQNGANCVERFGFTAADRLLIPVPLYHMYGLGAGFLPAVLAGTSISLMEGTNIIRFLDGEKSFEPTGALLTPILINMMLRARKGSYPYRVTVTAGDRIAKEAFSLYEKRFGRLFNLYGSTELGAIATTNPDDPPPLRSQAAVQPLPDVEIGIDPTIRCRHGSGFECYVDMAGNRLAEIEDGWFATGDLGADVGDGRFRVLGRTGNSVNRNGILVAFAEVESFIERGVAGVEHVVVTTGQEENERGRHMVAVCQLTKGAELDAREIRRLCFDVMSRHQVPDRVEVVNAIPRLPNGKFDRKAVEQFVNN